MAMKQFDLFTELTVLRPQDISELEVIVNEEILNNKNEKTYMD